jgi:hypothetical protein
MLRNPQGYEEFFGAEPTTAFAVRTMKEDLFLRVNPDPEYSLWEQYTVQTRHGTYFVFPHFRDALRVLSRPNRRHSSHPHRMPSRSASRSSRSQLPKN